MNNTYTDAKQMTETLNQSSRGLSSPVGGWPEGPMKDVLIDYVGSTNDSEEVTVEMIVETMAEEFPEFLMLIAEENFIRGYQQAIHDVDEGRKLIEEQSELNLDELTLRDGNA